ncbi:MAG: V-type ATPase subunit [Treponema sp.]|nr:V-type ATPase subunit [Treponema sp.]
MWNDNGYAYAKASWIIGKSFLGKRFSQLKGLHSLNDLDRLLFPDDYKELPGRELLTCLEKRIMERSVRQILRVINSYSEPPKLIVRMLKGFEYNDLKECLACIVAGKSEIPVISDIGRFGNVHFNMYPNITAMLRKTEFEYLLSRELKSMLPDMDLTPLEIKLDCRFYQGLIESLPQLSDEDRQTASRILADEISLFNCIMALRLRTYYHKSEAETAKYLMDFKLHGNMYRRKSSLAS